MTTDFYAYVHCKPDGTPFYVGKGYGHRAYDFKSNRNQHHKNTVAKHGADNILIGSMPCSTEALAFELEKGLIKCLRRVGVKLCNLTDGGEGVSGLRKTEAQIEAHRQAVTGRKQSEEEKAKRGRSRKAYYAAMPEDEKARMREATVARLVHDPVVLARRIAGQVRSWKDADERRGQTSAQQKRIGADPQEKKRRSERMLTLWGDKERRELRIEAQKQALASPEAKKRKGVATQKSWADPEARARRIAAIKAARNTPESKARTAAASRAVAAKKKALRNDSA